MEFYTVICGNTVIWKPSEKTLLYSIAIHNICQKVIKEYNYPEIFYTVISKDVEVSKTLVNDERVNLISFIGSTRVRQDVDQQVAKRFGKSILELRGNNATIIDESANLKLAIPAAVFGAVGQRCTY